MLQPKRSRRLRWLIAILLAFAMIAAACGDDDSTTAEEPAADEPAAEEPAADEPASGETVSVSLITKDSTNPFFVAMQEGAKKAADELGVDLTVGSGSEEGDDQGQIDLIENAISHGQAGILITPMSENVNNAISQARDAGLYVIALDTPTDPPEIVDITFATDNPGNRRGGGSTRGRFADLH